MPPTEKTDTSEAAKSLESRDSSEAAPKGTDRHGFVIAAVAAVACAGLVLYGVLNTEGKPQSRAIPTAEVTYEVTGSGTVEVAYLARSEAGEATVEKDVELPWKKSVQVPLGKAPSVNITLDGKGGQALCALAVHGRHVQSATASGTYGRATCTGELPAPTGESTG